MLAPRDFVPILIQPDLPVEPGKPGGGWPGVYKWSRQAVEMADGVLADNIVFFTHDILIVQVDADVADKKYSDASIQNPVGGDDLPCAEPCPPASATTNRLRDVVAVWLGGSPLPEKVVLCTPSKELEAWVVAALHPDDAKKHNNFECRKKPSNILKGKPKEERLVSGKKNDKSIDKYKEYAPKIADKWPAIKKTCTEAQRFNDEFLAAV